MLSLRRSPLPELKSLNSTQTFTEWWKLAYRGASAMIACSIWERALTCVPFPHINNLGRAAPVGLEVLS